DARADTLCRHRRYVRASLVGDTGTFASPNFADRGSFNALRSTHRLRVLGIELRVLARHGLTGAVAVAAAWVSNAIGGYSGASELLVAQQQAQRPAPTAAPSTNPQTQQPAPKAAPAAAHPPQAAPPNAAQSNAQPFPPPPEVFGFATVQRIAHERAMHPYENRSTRVPQVLAKLSYDQYRDIRFRRNYALWHNQSLFEVQFFHRGFNFDRRVSISEVSEGVVRPIEYNPAWF